LGRFMRSIWISVYARTDLAARSEHTGT
jgi:hypothetical protein